MQERKVFSTIRLRILLIAVVCTSLQCQSIRISYDLDVIQGYWRVTDYEVTRNSLKSDQTTVFRPMVQGHRTYVFLSDGSGCKLFNTDRSSFSWQIEGSGLDGNLEAPDSFDDIKGNTSEGDKFYVEINGQDTILHIWQPEADIHMTLVKEYSSHPNPIRDPMHAENNIWRQKKQSALTDIEIEMRAKNYLYHNLLLHEAALSDPNRNFSNKHTLGVLLYYKGAIGLCEPENISDEWLHIFEDWEEAQEVRGTILDIMGSKLLKSKKQMRDWVEMNHSILVEVLEGRD